MIIKKNSLLWRAGIAMGIVTFLAIAGMVSAIFVAQSTLGKAAAVNISGSLRMQSYRIFAHLEAASKNKHQIPKDILDLVAGFECRLNDENLLNNIHKSNRQSVRLMYAKIKAKWQFGMVPLIQQYIKLIYHSPHKSTITFSTEFQSAIDDFVADIDHLVRLLEEDTESRIHQLGLIQTLFLLITVFFAIITLFLIYTDILTPLNALIDSANRASKGDFSARVGNVKSDELGRLGQTFNHMAQELSKMYLALEERVKQKTAELRQRNKSLEMLYEASQFLTQAPVSEKSYQELLNKINEAIHTKGITLCHINDDKSQAYKLAKVGKPPSMCAASSCATCLNNENTGYIQCGEYKKNIYSIPIKDHEQKYGVLLVEGHHSERMQEWQTQVIETIAKHTGLSIGVAKRIQQNRRLALLDERSVIARELHDSLAQALSYLKIQVTRLSYLRKTNPDSNQIDEVISELKQGLNSAYLQLRELLTTFRIQMDENGLVSALEKTSASFQRKNQIKIQLENKLINYPFSVNEEIHILQIIREALNNIVKHAKADQATIHIFAKKQQIFVQIEDNGIGMPQNTDRTHHYGLVIMQERATSLNAELTFKSVKSGGTLVELVFAQHSTET